MTDNTLLTETTVTDLIQAITADAGPNTKTELNNRIINSDIDYQDRCTLIRELTLEGVIKDVYINDTAHWIPNNTQRTVTTGEYTIKATTTNASARFVSNDHSILIQRLKDRYQITVWWNGDDGSQKTADYYLQNPSLGETSQSKESAVTEPTPIILTPFSNDDEDTIGHMIDISPRTDMQNAISVITVKKETNGFNISLYIKTNIEQSKVTALTATFNDPRKTIP